MALIAALLLSDSEADGALNLLRSYFNFMLDEALAATWMCS